MSKTVEKTYWVLIPPKVSADDRLNYAEKFLYGMVWGLSNKYGYCDASNGYLAKRMGISSRTISRYLEKLENLNYLSRYVIRDGESKKVKKRKITPLMTELSGPHDRIDMTPHDRNVPESIKVLSIKEEYRVDKQPGESNDRKKEKYPKEDYTLVIDKYQELKGIQLQGKEFQPIQQAIKTMFMSGRTPDQIIRVMEWFNNSDEDWTDNWTINTVRMKLPEIIAKNSVKRKRSMTQDEMAMMDAIEKGFI